jgi:hypothetical protein
LSGMTALIPAAIFAISNRVFEVASSTKGHIVILLYVLLTIFTTQNLQLTGIRSSTIVRIFVIGCRMQIIPGA